MNGIRPINSLNEIFSSSSFLELAFRFINLSSTEENKIWITGKNWKKLLETLGEISIKRETRWKRDSKKKKKERKKTLHPSVSTEFSSTSDCTVSERGEKKKKKRKIPANYRSGNCSNAPLTNRRSREFTHSWRLSVHFRQFLRVSGTDALAA